MKAILSDSAAPTLRLCLLGAPRLMVDGEDVSRRVKYRKAWALWALLGTTRGQMHARALLAEWLWPERPATAAKANLRQVVADLRSLLDGLGLASCLVGSAQVIGLSRDARFSTDVEQLLRWAGACLQAQPPDGSLPEDALLEALPDGAFLQGLELPPLPDGSDWLSYMRDTCADARLQVLAFQARRAADRGQLPLAVATARRLLWLAPAQESHAVLLAELLQRQGQPQQAQQVVHQSIEHVEAQLGVAAMALKDWAPGGDERYPLPSHSPLTEWRRVSGVYSDVPQTLQTDEQAVEAWGRIWASMVGRAHGTVIAVPGLGWAAAFGLDDAGAEPARSACEMARQWLALGLADEVRAGVADARILVRPGLGASLLAGEAIHAAMRVCWQAAWGTWLTTQEVMLASRAAGFTRSPSAPGAPQLWAGSLHPAPPAPEMVPVIGRQRELDWLGAQWAASLQSGALAVLIRAPAGYGKSRLMRAMEEQVARLQGQVLRLACSRQIQDHPMMPWRMALGDTHPAGASRTTDDRQVLRAQVLEHLTRLAVHRPLLISLEDVHWADKATMDHLPVLLHQLQGHPVLLLMSARPMPEGELPAFARTLALDVLPPDAAHRFLKETQATAHLDAGERERLVDSAGGVPLILHWLARSRTAWTSAHAGIEALVQDQMDALGPGRVVLRAASVLGERFALSALQTLLPRHAVRTALTRAAQLHLVQRGDRDIWAFGHALVQEVVYEGIAPAQRRAWHAQAAAHLEAQDPVAADQVARHWDFAQSWEPAAHWWRLSGDVAIERDFAADALICYERAIAAVMRLPAGSGTAIKQAALQVQVGHCLHMIEGFGSAAAWRLFGQVEEALAAQPQADPVVQDLCFAALAGRYMGSSSQGLVGGLDLARQLGDRAQTPEQRLVARYALGNSLFWLGRLAEARSALLEAIALCDQLSLHHRLLYCSDDPALVCRAFLAWLCWFEGDEANLSHWAALLQARLGEPQRPHTVCFALTLLSCVQWCQGDWVALQASATRVQELAGPLRFPLWESVSSLLLICCQARQCARQDPDALHAAACRMQGAYQAGMTTSRWMVAWALVAHDLHEHAIPLLAQACSEALLHEDQYCVPQLHWLLAQCHRRRGDHASAQAFEAQAHEGARRMGAEGVIRQWARMGSPESESLARVDAAVVGPSA